MGKQIIKQLFYSGLTTLLLMLIPINSILASSNTTILKKGMSGNSVVQLQSNLKKLGFFNSEPTGYFGDNTYASVIEFQKYYGFEPDGIVGFFTFSEIERILDESYKGFSSTQIIIDPGHGGIDHGASKNGVVEKEITLDISKKLQFHLKQRGYKSILTRNTDKSLYELSDLGETIEERDLNARVRVINRNNAKLFVSIHVDSLPGDTYAEGSIVYYSQWILQSKTLAYSIQKELNSIIVNGQHRVSNTPETESFYILNFSNIPGVLIETAYITNKKERSLLIHESFRDQLAEAIADGIENSGLLD